MTTIKRNNSNDIKEKANNISENINTSTFESIIASNLKESIKKLHRALTPTDEFEFVFFSNKQNIERQKQINRLRRLGRPILTSTDSANINTNTTVNLEGINIMGFETFINLLEIMKYRSNNENLKINNTKTLDIMYTIKNTASYRITISNIDAANKYIEQLYTLKNHVIFKFLLELYKKGKEHISIIKKSRESSTMIDIDELDIRLKKSTELPVTAKEIESLLNIDETSRDDITFRYKERVSLILSKTKEHEISLDLTKTKLAFSIQNIDNEIPNYELEMELVTKNPNDNELDLIYKEITKILKVLQQSNYILTNTQKNNILEQYALMLELSPSTLKTLYGRRPESLEIQHVVDKLPNVYTVTDKADGERYQLVICNMLVYLVSDNLRVKYTGITLTNNQSHYNNTILDGEYIFLPKEQRHIFMAFDCLVKGGENIRNMPLLFDRLGQIDDLIDNVFTTNEQKGVKFETYDTSDFKFDLNKILTFHEKQITNFMNNLNNDIKVDKKKVLVRRKYFIFPFGKNDNEIFQYSVLIWNTMVIHNKAYCPYKLDGLIYTPSDQKYIASVKESKYIDYKWKTADKNSIDFYIQFMRNVDNKIITAYDNSGDKKYSKDKPYKIVQLFVGKANKNVETPVHFLPNLDLHIAYLFLENGEARDLEGKILQDKTVVEFYYNNDINVPRRFRWVPIRTRYDKTEYMQRHGKKYGNYIDIANKNWRSIENPFTFDDMLILSKDTMYTKHIDVLRNKIDHSIIISEQQDNSYYQVHTNLGKSMSTFHNWIKSITIYTYLNPVYANNVHMNVLDFGFGRGGDLMRMYYNAVNLFVGLDKDNNGIISPVNGAISRYNQFKKNNPRFPPMSFINADVTFPLEVEEQERVISNMSPQNKALMIKFFPKDNKAKQIFDCINCQFSIHYYPYNQTAWENFLNNINLYLKPGGIFLVTTFDADRVVEILKDKNNFTAEYVNDKGETKVFMDIIKKYNDEELYNKNGEIGIGMAIDVFNATISQDGFYNTEYLIQKKFLIRELSEKCNLQLLDTDLFENQYYLQEKYLKNFAKYEANPKTNKFLTDAISFYDTSNTVNKAAFQMSRLNRFYAFRKRENKQSGGYKDYKLNGMQRFFTKDYFKRKNNDIIKDYSFCNALYDILKTDKIIPKKITLQELFEDRLNKDIDLNEDNILNICNTLVINHDEEVDLPESTSENLTSDEELPTIIVKSKNVLDGINIICVQKNKADKKIIVNKYFKETNGNDNNKDNKDNKDNYIILYKTKNNQYYPIYKGSAQTNITGLFNKNNKTVEKFIK